MGLALLVGLMPLAPTASSAGPLTASTGCGSRQARSMLRSGAMETVVLKTFRIQVKPTEKSYKVGETAKIEVNVSRPGEEDPLELGVPITSPQYFPAEEVNVGVGLRVGDVFLFGFDITDEEGKAMVPVKIKPYTPGGTATADIFAWKTQANTPCLKVEENGYTQYPNIFKIIKTAVR
jgi:hypothetical protein